MCSLSSFLSLRSCSPDIGELSTPAWSCSPDIGELPKGLRGIFFSCQCFRIPQHSYSSSQYLILVAHPRTPSPLRGTSPISGEEYLALCLGQLLYVVCPLFSCLVKHGVTGIKQRLVVSGKRLVFPLPSRMVLLP